MVTWVLSAGAWFGGGPDNLWSDGSNWSTSYAPDPGDALVFQATTPVTAINDFPTGTAFQSITLASNGLVLEGNGITLTSISAPVVTLAAASGTIELPITLSSDLTFAVTDPQGSLTDSGNVNNGGFNLTFDTGSSQASTMSGSISGAGGDPQDGLRRSRPEGE